ncbi:MAG: N-acetylmuramoyl-L-alanine amidase [Calditrichaeota bacterium]|nr:MAG: N-acetylmuramoyl-L-alanine amidase [Calditrichota bacterium]
MDIYLNQKQQWGYRADYDHDDCFFIDIKRPPRKQNRSLKNVVVLLDPGHAPDSGAVGPTGLFERQANLELALTLADLLIKNGAFVQWTRSGAAGISLAERVQLADTSHADVLLSIHHNAIPEGVNPFKSRGSSVYYYHPQSLELARRIHQQLLKALELPDFGLYWDNLAMCRPTNMPALLLEPAFMMHPEEEMLIRSTKYRKNCARAIVKSLKQYFHEFRE